MVTTEDGSLTQIGQKEMHIQTEELLSFRAAMYQLGPGVTHKQIENQGEVGCFIRILYTTMVACGNTMGHFIRTLKKDKHNNNSSVVPKQQLSSDFTFSKVNCSESEPLTDVHLKPGFTQTMDMWASVKLTAYIIFILCNITVKNKYHFSISCNDY